MSQRPKRPFLGLRLLSFGQRKLGTYTPPSLANVQRTSSNDTSLTTDWSAEANNAPAQPVQQAPTTPQTNNEEYFSDPQIQSLSRIMRKHQEEREAQIQRQKENLPQNDEKRPPSARGIKRRAGIDYVSTSALSEDTTSNPPVQREPADEVTEESSDDEGDSSKVSTLTPSSNTSQNMNIAPVVDSPITSTQRKPVLSTAKPVQHQETKGQGIKPAQRIQRYTQPNLDFLQETQTTTFEPPAKIENSNFVSAEEAVHDTSATPIQPVQRVQRQTQAPDLTESDTPVQRVQRQTQAPDLTESDTPVQRVQRQTQQPDLSETDTPVQRVQRQTQAPDLSETDTPVQRVQRQTQAPDLSETDTPVQRVQQQTQAPDLSETDTPVQRVQRQTQQPNLTETDVPVQRMQRQTQQPDLSDTDVPVQRVQRQTQQPDLTETDVSVQRVQRQTQQPNLTETDVPVQRMQRQTQQPDLSDTDVPVQRVQRQTQAPDLSEPDTPVQRVQRQTQSSEQQEDLFTTLSDIGAVETPPTPSRRKPYTVPSMENSLDNSPEIPTTPSSDSGDKVQRMETGDKPLVEQKTVSAQRKSYTTPSLDEPFEESVITPTQSGEYQQPIDTANTSPVQRSTLPVQRQSYTTPSFEEPTQEGSSSPNLNPIDLGEALQSMGAVETPTVQRSAVPARRKPYVVPSPDEPLEESAITPTQSSKYQQPTDTTDTSPVQQQSYTTSSFEEPTQEDPNPTNLNPIDLGEALQSMGAVETPTVQRSAIPARRKPYVVPSPDEPLEESAITPTQSSKYQQPTDTTDTSPVQRSTVPVQRQSYTTSSFEEPTQEDPNPTNLNPIDLGEALQSMGAVETPTVQRSNVPPRRKEYQPPQVDLDIEPSEVPVQQKVTAEAPVETQPSETTVVRRAAKNSVEASLLKALGKPADMPIVGKWDDNTPELPKPSETIVQRVPDQDIQRTVAIEEITSTVEAGNQQTQISDEEVDSIAHKVLKMIRQKLRHERERRDLK
jgi:hypothetical protein